MKILLKPLGIAIHDKKELASCLDEISNHVFKTWPAAGAFKCYSRVLGRKLYNVSN